MSVLLKIYKAAMLTLVLTCIHHGYGAYIYKAPFRLHIVFIALPAMLILWGADKVNRLYPNVWQGMVARWIFFSLVIIFPLGLIGLFEGAYNHLLKNILYFSGAPDALFSQLFPPPTYELPNDIFFEVTGIGQFVTGIMIVYSLLLFFKRKHLVHKLS